MTFLPERDPNAIISFASLLNNARPMLVILALANPHLMKRAQAGQDAAADPGRKSALGDVTGGLDADAQGGELRAQLGIDAVYEVRDQRGAACYDDVGEERRLQIRVDGCEGGLDQRGERGAGGGERACVAWVLPSC